MNNKFDHKKFKTVSYKSYSTVINIFSVSYKKTEISGFERKINI